MRLPGNGCEYAIDEELRVLLAQRKFVQARARLIERLGIELSPTAGSG